MKYKLILILIFMILSTSLFAQYDEKKILLKNASDMIKVRKYTLAEELYEEALNKFPKDLDVITASLDYFVSTNKGKEGAELLQAKGDLLPVSKKIQYQITFMLIEKNYELALAKTQEYLKDNNSQSEYKSLGSLLQRYRAYPQASEIFQAGDKLYPNQFAYDIAESYYFERNFDSAIRYYLIAIENNIGNKSQSEYKIRRIITESPDSILTLIEYFGTDSDKIQIPKNNVSTSIVNAFVDALLNTGREETAFAILDKYEAKDIRTKAIQFGRLKKYHISKLLFEKTLEKKDDLNLFVNSTLDFARMMVESGTFAEADSLLNNIIEGDFNDKYKRNALFETYLLKAEIVSRNRKLSDKYEFFLEKAEDYAFTSNQKQIVKAKFSYYKILKQEYPQAKKILDELGRYGYKENYFFNYYLYETFQGGAQADSLATELIIQAPESDLTIEMLELKYILKGLSGKDKNLFLDAYRSEKLNLTEEADSLYQEIFKSTQNEYFRIRNAMLNKTNNNLMRTRELLTNTYNDRFCHDFAALQLVLLEDENSQNAKDMARNFLTQYPNSSFAAQVRQILMINQNN